MDNFPNDPFDGSVAADPDRGRDSLFLTAKIRSVGSTEEQMVRVRNLSPGGLMAEYQGELVPGAKVDCTVRGIGRVSGQVVWVENGRIGVTFVRQINPMLARKPVGVASKTSVYLKSDPRR